MSAPVVTMLVEEIVVSVAVISPVAVSYYRYRHQDRHISITRKYTEPTVHTLAVNDETAHPAQLVASFPTTTAAPAAAPAAVAGNVPGTLEVGPFVAGCSWM